MERLYFETAPYEELCGCVSINLNEKEERALEYAEQIGRREDFMRKKFAGDRQRSYMADCPKCDAGIAL
jgi:hypothetical protein